MNMSQMEAHKQILYESKEKSKGYLKVELVNAK